MQVIFRQIGNHPDELKYQRLNVLNLSNILYNCALSLDLLIKFGFKYVSNKSQLTFIGVAQYISHEQEIMQMLHARKFSWVLAQGAIRACFRADKDTRETFDSDTPPYGVFINDQVFSTSWENRTISNKTETTLRIKEMCSLNSFEDMFEHLFIIKSDYDTNRMKKMQVYVFNNQGGYFKWIDWDQIDIGKLFFNFCRRYGGDHQLHVKFNQILSTFLSSTNKDEKKINFFKKCVKFLGDYYRDHYTQQADLCFGALPPCYTVQKYYYDLLSRLNKNEHLLKKVSTLFVWHISVIANMIGNTSQYTDDHDVIQQHINSIVKPMIQRLKKSKKICKYIKNSMLLEKENSVDYVWTCLLCNTKNKYNFGKCNAFCSSCEWNQWDELYSMCPLYFLVENESITFGIDPRIKPFYIINYHGHKQYDCNKYSDIQVMMEHNNHLKLSTIVVGKNNMPVIIILFQKSNPLTLYELKHLLFEIKLFAMHGKNKAKMWTFGDVMFSDPNDANILNKLSDDSIIDIVEPCYVDMNRMRFDLKIRRPVEFGKTQFDQGYYHSYFNTYNINTNINNNNIDDNNYWAGKVIKPIETSDTNEKFDFEYSSCDALTYRAENERLGFLGEKRGFTTRINKLLYLVKEVIRNGYEKDLLPVDNDTSINMIDKIVHEYETKTNTSILDSQNEEHGNYGIFNKFNMGLINELSKVYKIFDQQWLQSLMFHSRHKLMGYPLSCDEMLALMLCCDGECNHDLRKSQRSYTVMKKWPYFHCILNMAIKTLSKFEIHYEHIYTGICGVFFETNNEVTHVGFQKNVSFSTDLNVALQYRGDSGMVIGVNVKRTFNNPFMMDRFDVCDVSWISSFVCDKEILCRAGSKIRIYPNLVRKRGNTQWIACVEDELDHDKAFKSMFGSLAD